MSGSLKKACLPRREISERKLHRQLQLSWISDTLSEETVEVEQGGCAQRVNKVLVVEGIEHLDNGYQRVALTKLEWTLQSPIKRQILVVFPQ